MQYVDGSETRSVRDLCANPIGVFTELSIQYSDGNKTLTVAAELL